MIDNLVRDLQVLRKADSLIGRIWLEVLARRFALLVFAALIGVFGLGMANLAGFYLLQSPVGSVWAASIVAAIDLAMAAIVMFAAIRSAPGSEIEIAMDVRNMAIDAIQTDARNLKLTIDSIGQELRDVKATVLGFARNPLDVAAQKLLIPAALSVIKGMRSKSH